MLEHSPGGEDADGGPSVAPMRHPDQIADHVDAASPMTADLVGFRRVRRHSHHRP